MDKNSSTVEKDNAAAHLLLEMVKKVTSASPGGNSSRMIVMEVDGKFVEMNSVDYSIFKKQREQLLAVLAKFKNIPQKVLESGIHHTEASSADA
jgi:hypothetical protein